MLFVIWGYVGKVSRLEVWGGMGREHASANHSESPRRATSSVTGC